MPLKNNPGMNRLANVLSGRMKKEMLSAVDLPFDFGTIGNDMGLVTDAYPEVIPKGEYLVCRQPAAELISGDRVLVAWVADDAVVIDVIEET